MARRKADSDHRPIPVSASGVMLEEKIVPNGVGTGSPPAKFLPPRTVWQSLQLPIAARSRPRFTRAASSACGAGGSIDAIAGRQVIANAAAAPAASTIPITLAMIRDGRVMRSRCSRLSLDDASFQRFELDDRRAVVAADPERDRRGRTVDEHPPDVGGARQQVVDRFAGLGVEPRDLVAQHRTGPGLLVLVGHDVV